MPRLMTLNRQPGNKGPDAPVSRLGAASAAAQEFTCWCGLKTHDLTRPCPHWWNLLLGWCNF